MTAPASPTCANCGAPDAGDLVICRFCHQAVSKEAQATAIPCPNPKCAIPNRWGKQKCAQCQSWLVVSCVFCGSLSPHNISNCLQCQEAFAGAPQRKAQREAQVQHQQNMQNMNAFGNIASGLLGGMAGAAIGSGFSSGSSWDSDSSSSSGDGGFSEGFTGESGISDGATFDFGGGGDDSGGGGDFGGGGSSDDF